MEGDQNSAIAVIHEKVASLAREMDAKVASLSREIDANDKRNDRRLEKIEGSFKWGAMLIIGIVISQLLKLLGVGV